MPSVGKIAVLAVGAAAALGYLAKKWMAASVVRAVADPEQIYPDPEIDYVEVVVIAVPDRDRRSQRRELAEVSHSARARDRRALWGPRFRQRKVPLVHNPIALSDLCRSRVLKSFLPMKTSGFIETLGLPKRLSDFIFSDCTVVE